MTKRTAAIAAALLLWQGFSGLGATEDKTLEVTPESAAWTATESSPYGDPTRFVSPCQTLPADRTPRDSDPTNDGGWLLVDFCTAGPTGSGPAQPPFCTKNDDDSGLLPLGFIFDMYGGTYDEVFVNNNGNLSFGQLLSGFDPAGFPLAGPAVLAPFWADVDTRTEGGGKEGDGAGDSTRPPSAVWYKPIGENTLAVTWDNVGYFKRRNDKVNTFQVLISDGNNPEFGVGNNVCFCYDDMQWTTGDASGGVGGFGGAAATVGANAGDGERHFVVGRFDRSGAGYDGPGGMNDGVDYLDGRGAGNANAICFNASGNNVPPVPQGFPEQEPLQLACNETLDLDLAFLSPEGDQTTTVMVQDLDDASEFGLEIETTSGNVATAHLFWETDPRDEGTYVLEFAATDDFNPPATTERTLTLEVTCFATTPLPNVSEEVVAIGSESRIGTSVSSAGDLDGDGFADFISGAPGFQDGPFNSAPETGAAAIYLGSPDAEERIQPDIVFVGEAGNDRAGVAVFGDFDFNGDEIPDLLIGAEQVDRTGEAPLASGNGKVYLIFFDPADTETYPVLAGGEGPDYVELSRVGVDIPGVVFEGAALGDQAGFAVAAGSAVSSNGGVEIAIGAPGADIADEQTRTDAGAVYLIFNQALPSTASLDQVADGSEVPIEGVVYQGAAAGDALGFSVAFPGDVVAPMGDDLAMGAPLADTTIGPEDQDLQNAGIAYGAAGGFSLSGIIEVCDLGQPGGGITEVEGVQILGDQAGAQLGFSIGGGRDHLFNGETDLLIGAPLYDIIDASDADRLDAGIVAVAAAQLAGGIIEVCDLGGGIQGAGDGPVLEGVWFVGATDGDQLGYAVSGLGDFTQNGADDLALGAPFFDAEASLMDAGILYIAEGRFGGGGETDGAFFSGIIEVCDLGDSQPGRGLTGTAASEEAGSSAAPTGDVDGDGQDDAVVGSPGKQEDDGTVSIVTDGTDVANQVPNQPPVADASATVLFAECEAGEGTVRLDGTRSSDPDGNIVRYEWFENGVSIASGAVADVVLSFGDHTIVLRVTDAFDAFDEDVVVVAVGDTEAPLGGIVSPGEGECFGPGQTPVTVLDDFADTCSTEVTIGYSCVGPCEADQGPEYAAHGDHAVLVTATDAAGNPASDSVRFTIDTVAPVVTIADPPGTTVIPGDLPLDLVFEANDDDGATGEIAHERILLNGCLLYDGFTYGDGDGLLEGPPEDPALVLDEALLCQVAETCGWTSLIEPVLTVEATDACGGNVGIDTLALGGAVSIRPGLCTSIELAVSGPNTTAEWDEQQGAVEYDVIRGDLAALRAVDGEIDLGAVTCVEGGSDDTSTSGNEDEVVPPVGGVFFFLVQSDDGRLQSGYGEDSAERKRTIRPGNGGCD